MAMGMAAILGVVSAVRTLIVPINDGEQVTVVSSRKYGIQLLSHCIGFRSNQSPFLFL